jgi:hypothetical protein
MLTVAVPDGEAAPDIFFVDMRGVPWDGSAGVTLTAAWDGHGMAATQRQRSFCRAFGAASASTVMRPFESATIAAWSRFR